MTSLRGLEIKPPRRKCSFKADLVITDDGHPQLMDPHSPDKMWYSLHPCHPDLQNNLLPKYFTVYYPVQLRNKSYMDKWTGKLITTKTPLNLQNLLEVNDDGSSKDIRESLGNFFVHMLKQILRVAGADKADEESESEVDDEVDDEERRMISDSEHASSDDENRNRGQSSKGQTDDERTSRNRCSSSDESSNEEGEREKKKKSTLSTKRKREDEDEEPFVNESEFLSSLFQIAKHVPQNEAIGRAVRGYSTLPADDDAQPGCSSKPTLKKPNTKKKETSRYEEHIMGVDAFAEKCRSYVAANLYAEGNITQFLKDNNRLGFYAFFQKCFPQIGGAELFCCGTSFPCQNENQYQKFQAHVMAVHYRYHINCVKEQKDTESRIETIATLVKDICVTHGQPTTAILNVDNEADAAAFRRLAPQKKCAKR